MKLTGNILDIKTKRDSRHKDIALQIDKIEYITYRKDGKYHQPFDFVRELDTPLIITGDCLARAPEKSSEEDEFAFQVYDLVDGEYVLNPDKKLSVTLAYDEEENIQLLTFAEYTVTVSNEEFKELKKASAVSRKQPKGKKNR